METPAIYGTFLAIHIAELIVLGVLIVANIVRLIRHLRRRVVGSRLTLRLVLMFSVLAMVPVSIVFSLSLDFVRRGIDSWFDARIEQGITKTLELNRGVTAERMQAMAQQTQLLAAQLSPMEMRTRTQFPRLAALSTALQMALLDSRGRVLAQYGIPLQTAPLLPKRLPFIALDNHDAQRPTVLVMVSAEGNNVLYARYALPAQISALAAQAYDVQMRYQELVALRKPLRRTFAITLSIALFLGIFLALWAAFWSARRLTEPIGTLAVGTRAVARGEYGKQLEVPAQQDELAVLVQSFNEMTRRVASAHDAVRMSQHHAERQRAYLETVLSRLSSGVITIDDQHILRTANATASSILGVTTLHGTPLRELTQLRAGLEPFVTAVMPHLADAAQEWREEVLLLGAQSRQVLILRGAALPSSPSQSGGHVIVFDDITTLIQAQRDAAWSEVARRLAHEIKNPLTPIQLAAERLRHKLLKSLADPEAEILNRATHTIIQQVDALKELVKDFYSYARPQRLMPQPLDLNQLIGDVLDLYHDGGGESPQFITQLAASLPHIEADAGRLRQVLHNLIKNALEAHPEGVTVVTIRTQALTAQEHLWVELQLADNGPGLNHEVLGRAFEPGVTTKTKGSGLGLAIVKRIVEDHGGVVTAANQSQGGAVFTVRLPCRAEAMRAGDTNNTPL